MREAQQASLTPSMMLTSTVGHVCCFDSVGVL
jgi:hypothetical protein